MKKEVGKQWKILLLKLDFKMFSFFGKILVFVGFLLILIGAVFLLSPKIPFLGKLPGDIYIRKENFTFYAPIGTCFLISIILSIIFYIIFRFLR